MLGPVEPAELGVTLPHEHLLLDFTAAKRDPCYCSDIAGLEFKIENLGKIRQFPYVLTS